MGKKPLPIIEPEGFLLDPMRDLFLFMGPYKLVFYVVLAVFCAANARTILVASPKINYWHGCALMVLANFGGSTLSAIMCGAPVAFVCNEALVTVCLAVWTVMFMLPKATVALLNYTIGNLVTSCCYETMRCHVLMNCTKQAATVLPDVLIKPFALGPVPIVGPLIAGTLGGCGGGFMPLNKGLDPLAGGTNWRIASAAVASVWMFLSTQYPPTVAMIGLSYDYARFACVAFMVFTPLFTALTGVAPFGANPLIVVKAKASAAKKKN